MTFERLRLQGIVLIGALRAATVRSLLVMIAVGIGSASLMMTLAMSAGAERRVQTLAALLGRGLLTVRAGQAAVDTVTSRLRSRLTLADAAELGDEIPGVRLSLPVFQRDDVSVRSTGESYFATVLGVTRPYFDARNWQLDSGRLIDEIDDSARGRVAVVGATVGRSLNLGDDLVGSTLLIAGVPFQVVGQLREKGLGFGDRSEDSNIYVPLQASLRRLFGADDPSLVLVQVREGESLTAVEQDIAEVLRNAHRLRPHDADDFEVLNYGRQEQVTSETGVLVQRISRIVAAILLVLGGVGVFAVTYLNVMQRNSEIGLRRALGARKADIATLFTAEACLLSILGGCLGCLLGTLVVRGLARWTQWAVSIELKVVAAPLVIAAVIGIVFGVLPALRAARLPPVEALRAA